MSFAWLVASAPRRSRPDKTAMQAKAAKKIKRGMKVLFCLSRGLYLRTFREILQAPQASEICFERLIQVRDEISSVFESDRKAQQILRRFGTRPLN